MLKVSKIIYLTILAGLFFIGLPKVFAESLKNDNVYKVVVKIYTYYLDKNDNFAIGNVGTGVIISEDGQVLTNKHTITVSDDSGIELPVAFKVCLTRDDPYKEPICNYTADLSGKDDKTDLALLKIKFPNSNSTYSFNYPKLSSRQVSKDQMVYAYGYPGAAGDTIFGLVGKINGVIIKNNFSMIQNDTLPFFGSDGGVLFNADAELIGITNDFSQVTGDALGVDSINLFLGKHSLKTVQYTVLQKKFNIFLNKLIDAKANRKFVSESPGLELSWGKERLFVGNTLQNIGIFNQIEIVTPVNSRSKNYIPWSPDFIKQFQHSILVDNVNSFKDNLLSSIAPNFVKSKLDAPVFNRPEFEKIIIDHLEKIKAPWRSDRTFISAKKIEVVSPVNNNGWFLNLNWVPVEENVDKDFLNNAVSKTKLDGSCVDQGNISIAEKVGRKIICQYSGMAFQVILTGSNNYLISIIYSYGRDEANQNDPSIDIILKNIKISDQPNNSKPLTTSNVIFQEQPKSETAKSEVKIETKLETPLLDSSVTAVNVQLIKGLGKRFMGQILLRVQNNGEAWYLSPKTNQAHYLANGNAAYQLMREQGLGMSTKDLAKIPIGLSKLSGEDADQDGLTDALETALGTDKDKADTDGDGFNDNDEMLKGFNPLQKGTARAMNNLAFANRFKGKILLQVESRGQAWYVNPKDGKRYFLGTAEDAYQVMKQQSMGIAEKDFVKL